MKFPLYVLAGILPSFVWLLFYLKKDSHPESNSMVLKTFFFGMLVSIPVIVVEIGFYKLFSLLNIPTVLMAMVNAVIGTAFTEEFFKFLTMKLTVLKSSELDEPVDAVLYMIIIALGFAASENILLLFKDHPVLKIPDVLSLVLIRFIGATFLHALCSGIVGFFTALAIYWAKRRKLFFLVGIAAATLLHGLYNFSIISLTDDFKFLVPLAIIVSLASFVSIAFSKLKKLKSVCRI